MPTETLSIKVPREKKIRLQAIAKARKTKPSALVREALDLVLDQATASQRPSCYELAKDLMRNLGDSGLSDLSTNPKYMEDFGK